MLFKTKNKTDVILDNSKNVVIDSTKRLPKLDWGGLSAYAATKTVLGEATACFALICDRALMPRFESVEPYIPLLNSGLRHLIEHGSAYWPPEKKECYIFIYEYHDATQLVTEDDNDTALGIKPAIVREKIVPFFIRLLQKLEEACLSHGSLCVSNIYTSEGGGEYEDIAAGDMLALPFGYAQPNVYKTIPVMMAGTTGRGEGRISDDIYAFGVSLALMLRSKPPLRGKSNEEMLLLKMKNGSYSTLLGAERFGTAFFELLRGVLHDDPQKRWSVEEISLWAENRSLTPKQFVRDKSAPRPLEFNGTKYEQVSYLAKDLVNNPPEVSSLVENGQLMHWLERSVADKNLTDCVQKAISYMSGNIKAIDRSYALVAAISNAMQPQNPLMYKELRFFPNAICSIMVECSVKGYDLNPILEVLRYGIVSSWCAFQINDHPDLSSEIKTIEKCLSELRNSRIGHGTERCIYMLSSHVPCLSPTFKNYYVSDTKRLITLADQLLEHKKIDFSNLMDRHIAAFIAQHNPKMIEKTIFDLHAEKKGDYILAILKIYAQGQLVHKIKKLPHLAAIFEKKIGPCYDIYHDKKLREDLKKRAKEAAKSGDLVKMVELFTEVKRLRRDRYKYLAANQEYINLESERVRLIEMLRDKKLFAAALDRRMPIVAAAIIALGMVVFAIMSF